MVLKTLSIIYYFRETTHSTVASANGGLDMTMPGDIVMGDGYSYYGKNLTDAVGRGDVTEERVRTTHTKLCYSTI